MSKHGKVREVSYTEQTKHNELHVNKWDDRQL